MKVRVTVEVEVEPCDPADFQGSTGEYQEAAVEAIRHAVKHGEGEGFVHDLSDDVSITVLAVTLDESDEG